MGQATSSLSSEKVILEGHCDKQYEPVKEKLRDMLKNGLEDNLQLCVYVDGKCVIDLYGSATGDMNYDAEKIQTIFSSGKSFESVALAILYDKGLFEYEDKVTKYWPEFGQNGKEDIKISDVCQHRTGLANFFVSPSIRNTWTENIKKNNLGALIEKLKPNYPQLEKHGSKCEYHAFTRGWIINEIIRRIDPKHRTMDEIFREEVNIDGIHITLGENETQKLVGLTQLGVSSTLIESMKPKWAGRRFDPNIFTYGLGFIGMLTSIPGMVKNGTYKPMSLFKEFEGKNFLSDIADFSTSPDALKSESTSAFSYGNARGCAKLASKLANGGEDLMSEKTWNKLHSEPRKEAMMDTPGGPIRSNFTKGGVNYHVKFDDSGPYSGEKWVYDNHYGYYGWMGYGGSILQWNPEKKIGFAFVPTSLNFLTDPLNHRGGHLQKLVTDCTN